MSVFRRAAFGIPAPRVLQLDRTILNVNEGSTATFRVRLSRIPSANVTVTARSNDTDEATVSPLSRTFTRSNFNTYQTFTVSGVHDTDPTNEDTSILLTSAGGGYTDTASLAVTVFDDDARGLRTSANSFSMEAGQTRNLDVRLLTLPTGTVTVAVASGDTNTATVNKNSLSFTTANWNTDQRVVISASASAAGSTTVTLNPSGADYGSVATVSIPVTVTADRMIETDKDSLTVDENSTGTFRVRLSHQPTGNVTVSVASDDTDAATISPNSLTFSTTNWNTYKTVTVRGVNDNVAGNKSATINLSASGGGVTDTHAVSVTVRDNDRREVRTSDSSLSLAEADNSKTLGVFLGTEPTGDVTVAASVSPGIVGVSPGSRVYDDTDFNAQKFFTFSRRTGQHGSATITLNPSGADYGSVANRTVGLTVAERFEAGGLDIQDASPSVAGGSSVNLRVRLTQKPRSNVTVALTEASSLISLGTASLTFTQSNWNTYQTVAVSASGNRQSIDIAASKHTIPSGVTVAWRWTPPRPQVISGLRGGNATYIAALELGSGTRRRNPGGVFLSFVDSASSGLPGIGDDLSNLFETNGSITVIAGTNTITVAMAGLDRSNLYEFTPSNSADVGAFFSALPTTPGTQSATVILRDYTPGSATVNLSASGPSEYAGVSGSAAVSVT